MTTRLYWVGYSCSEDEYQDVSSHGKHWDGTMSHNYTWAVSKFNMWVEQTKNGDSDFRQAVLIQIDFDIIAGTCSSMLVKKYIHVPVKTVVYNKQDVPTKTVSNKSPKVKIGNTHNLLDTVGAPVWSSSIAAVPSPYSNPTSSWPDPSTDFQALYNEVMSL